MSAGAEKEVEKPQKPKEEKIEPKKVKKTYKPEADYFRKALMAIGN